MLDLEAAPWTWAAAYLMVWAYGCAEEGEHEDPAHKAELTER